MTWRYRSVPHTMHLYDEVSFKFAWLSMRWRFWETTHQYANWSEWSG